MIGLIAWLILIFIICIAIYGWAFIGMLLVGFGSGAVIVALILWLRYKITGKKPD